jgi:tRNA pseudouridine38-40 synthase
MKNIHNIKLVLAFDGTAYHGWQIQTDQSTIQGALAAAIEKITGEKISPTGSGRTDAGTHARRLVVNFPTHSQISPERMVRALNSSLPGDIRVLSARRVSRQFHARRDAQSKTYRYQVYLGSVMPPHLAREHYHYPHPINVEKMKEAARIFEGEHDFASFAAKCGQGNSSKADSQIPRNTVRRIFQCELKHRGSRLLLTVEGNGFLQHMVRNIIGTLLEIGGGRMRLEELEKLFEKRDRRLAGFAAPAHGLILLKVRY